MSSDLLNSILYRKIPSFASIHINSLTFQKCHYLFLMSLLNKSEYDLKIINFDPLFYRFYLSHKNSSSKNEFSFISSNDNIEEIFSSFNKNNNYILITGLNLLHEKEKISEFFYHLKKIKQSLNISKIIFISFKSDFFSNDLINNNCIFSLNEISHIINKDKLYIKYDFYNHKKLSKENIVLSFSLNEQKGLISSFNEVLVHNLELQKIFNEIEKPIEHKTQMNLKLTEEERKAKDELVLPFIKSEEEKQKELNKNINDEDDNNEEEIEEDPDADLDI